MNNPTDARARLDAIVARALRISSQYAMPDEADQDDLDRLTDFDIPELVAEVRGLRIELEKAHERIANHQPVLNALAEARARIAELSQQRDDLLAETVTMLDVPDDTPQQLRDRAEKAEARIAAVLALHPRHADSEHCQRDGESWPCPTVRAAQS